MNKSKTFLLLGVVVAVLVLGIAYAAIQDVTLSVAGNVTASPDQGNFKVGFTGEHQVEGLAGTLNFFDTNNGGAVPEGGYANYVVFDELTGLDGVGDKGTIALTIENGSTDISSTLSASAEISNTEYFKITPVLAANELGAKGTTTDSTTLTLTVECIKTPVEGAVTGYVSARVIAAPHN